MDEIKKRINELKEKKREIEKEIKELQDNTVRFGEFVKFDKYVGEQTKWLHLKIYLYGNSPKWYRVYSGASKEEMLDYTNQLIKDLTEFSDTLADWEV